VELRPKAITAAAHKLARIVYHLLTTRQPYDESIFIEQELRFRKRKEARLRAQARELGFSAGAGRGYSLSLVP
jgi:transposase